MKTPTLSLNELVASIKPELSDDRYLFCSMSQERRDTLEAEPIVEIHEPEGVTVVLSQEDAANEEVEGRFLSRMITLNVVQQRFDSAGLLAAVATRLASHGISIEPAAGYHHGYVFVPAARAEESLKLLTELASQCRSAKVGPSEVYRLAAL